jgi:hypothetical protein
LTFLNILELEGVADIQAKLKELEELNQSGFDIYSDEERGDFTFIEAREL